MSRPSAIPVYDEMAENAIQLADPTEFLQALHEMEDYLVEENVYLIPLFEYLTPYLVADGIQGITLNGVWPLLRLLHDCRRINDV